MHRRLFLPSSEPIPGDIYTPPTVLSLVSFRHLENKNLVSLQCLVEGPN